MPAAPSQPKLSNKQILPFFFLGLVWDAVAVVFFYLVIRPLFQGRATMFYFNHKPLILRPQDTELATALTATVAMFFLGGLFWLGYGVFLLWRRHQKQ